MILSPLPQRLKKYDFPLYRRENGQFVLHRVVKVGQRYTCIGDHQFVLEEGLCHEQMLAVVTGFVRKGKTYSVAHPGYWLYCRFWHYSRPIRHFWLRGIRFLRRVCGCQKKRK